MWSARLFTPLAYADMHELREHVPDLMEKHENMLMYCCEGLEAIQGRCQWIFHTGTSRKRVSSTYFDAGIREFISHVLFLGAGALHNPFGQVQLQI